MKTIQITNEGKAKLTTELQELNGKKPLLIEKVHKARSMGDLSENNAYHAAREELTFLERRIHEIEDILRSAQVVEHNMQSNAASLGKIVTVKKAQEEKTFRIVGEFEADPAKGDISVTSPIGKALIGKRKGDIVLVSTPGGSYSVTICSIK